MAPDMTVAEYYHKFNEKSRYAEDIEVSQENLALRFEKGLTPKIMEKVPLGVLTMLRKFMSAPEELRGVIVRNKARLVVQGYYQQEGIDFDETFPPIARLDAIRLLIAFAAHMDIKLFQMDVKTAFLNGYLQEEVYVEQPPDFLDSKFPKHVYKLDKALYGLKQAPRSWYDRLSKFLLDNGFQRGSVDKTLFLKPDLYLWYPMDCNFTLTGYSDADYEGCLVQRKSASGVATLVGLCLISCASKKQNMVALSIVESEYVAAAQCCSQILWVRQQLWDYGMIINYAPILCDNTSAINISKNPFSIAGQNILTFVIIFFVIMYKKGT
ncbi:uncharacterized protein LOC141630144 [Silene latifolia]|uniref:uncharacterized protein LOC141630144 n=1 Tax=Silene latifolia TaxID=37657 RepID=UPI003D77E6FD